MYVCVCGGGGRKSKILDKQNKKKASSPIMKILIRVVYGGGGTYAYFVQLISWFSLTIFCLVPKKLGWGPCYYVYVAVPEDGRAGVNPVNDRKLVATFFLLDHKNREILA